MLGKGLESLIPQKGNGNGSNDPSSRPPASQPMPHTPQQTVPQQPTLRADEERPHVQPPSEPPVQPQPQPLPPQRQPEPLSPEPEFPKLPPEPEPVLFAPEEKMRHEPHIGKAPSWSEKSVVPKSSSDEEEEIGSVFHIEVNRIKPNPDQPRRIFDESALRDLAHSIREFGFLQPLVVSKIEKETADGVSVEYQLIAGERRLMAAKMLGLDAVPAIVRNVSLEREKLELAVIENLQREQLNPIETARAFQRLQEEFRMTQREIAAKLGKSREVVANTVRLLDLPEFLQLAVQEGKLSESHARMLLAVEDPGAQKRLYEEIVGNKLTTRDVKDRIVAVTGKRGRGRPPKSAEKPLPPELKAMQESLSMDLGAPVEIHKGDANGKITITFYSEEELESILRRLGQE